MLATTIFLPDKTSFSCLEKLIAPVQVLEEPGLTGNATELQLTDKATNVVRLSVDYTDVRFKFECFGLMVDPVSTTLRSDFKQIINDDDWDHIKCLFRFEWERTALSGEVPEQWEPVVRERGNRGSVSHSANAIGISLVGLIFWNSKDNLPSFSITINDEEPATVCICRNRKSIEDFKAECECVDLSDAQLWISGLYEWLDSFKKKHED